MTLTHTFRVYGVPAPQGSKKHIGKGVMVESSKRVRPWREAVKTGIAADLGPDPYMLTVPTYVDIRFVFTRPKSHYRTGRNAHLLKDSAPPRPTSKQLGDVDKLQRATFDALTDCGVIADDALIVEVYATKEYGTRPGAQVIVGTARVGNVPPTWADEGPPPLPRGGET